MAASQPKTLAATCPQCGCKFEVGVELAGRPGRCKCGHVFVLPAMGGGTPLVVAPPKRPQFIGVSCHVCGTRMFGPPDMVGKPLKCPDCGAATVLPPPEAEKPPSMPAALEGEQYELWDVDTAPSNEALAAAEPKYVPVMCNVCKTLMYALPEHVGKKIKCPDCKTVQIIPPPPAPKRPTHQLVADAYELDASSAIVAPLPVLVPPRRPMVYEEERDAELARQAAKRAGGNNRGPQYDANGRPILPRWPLVTRVLPFLLSRGVPARWAMFSATLLFVLALFGSGLSTIGPAGGIQATGIAVIGGVCLSLFAFVVSVVWFSAFAATLITIITESSEGNDEVQQWPSGVVADWLAYMLSLWIALAASAFPGWLVGRALEEGWPRVGAVAVSMLLCYPIVQLSQLEIGTMFGIASGRILASLAKCPFSWMMWYFEAAALVAICVGIIRLERFLGGFAVFVAVPVAVAAAILVARILGRLAWKLAETMPAVENAGQDGRAI